MSARAVITAQREMIRTQKQVQKARNKQTGAKSKGPRLSYIPRP